MINIKRIYEPPGNRDGYRILVDRLWPRGLSKEKAKIDLWLKEIAPSHELRKWFAHNPQRWPEFRERYFLEFELRKDLVDQIIQRVAQRQVTLLYAAQNHGFNNATALKEYIERRV